MRYEQSGCVKVSVATLMILAASCSAPSSIDSGVELRCTAAAVACTDESIQKLRFFDLNDAGMPAVNPGAVTEEGTISGEFTTHLDAIAGGLTPNTSYVYGRFTPTGFEKLALSDVEALGSMDWDLSVRRYVMRINSGVGGPSCTEAARLAPGTTFESVTEVPANLMWRTEEYFTGTSCEYVAETSGIGSPATALSSFWQYSGCVQMTDNVFVLHLNSGRYVKLQVLSYYSPDIQAECNDAGVAQMPNGAGNIRIRWAYIAAPP